MTQSIQAPLTSGKLPKSCCTPFKEGVVPVCRLMYTLSPMIWAESGGVPEAGPPLAPLNSQIISGLAA